MIKPYYENKETGITIYCGDCREVMPQLDIKVDLVLTDPPFYLPAKISTSRKSWPRSLGNLVIMNSYFAYAFSDIVSIMKPSGAFYSFCDSTSYAVFLCVLYSLFDRTQMIVWDKKRGGMGHGWRHSTELLIHGAWNDTTYAKGFRRDVLSIPVIDSGDRNHPSEKPIEILSTILQAHEDGLIFDPYMGVGSTLIASKILGRKCVGIEIDEKYCQIAVERLNQGVMKLEVENGQEAGQAT